MKTLLKEIGIDDLDGFIYEYEPLKLDWWDSENEIAIEIDVYEFEENFYEISVIFCPEVEGIVERTIVFTTSYKSELLECQTLFAKLIYKQFAAAKTFELLEEQNAYFTNSIEDTKEILAQLIKLIANKQPKYTVSLNQDDKSEEVPIETGDTLEHFIAMMMMCLDSTELTKDVIIENLEMGLEHEGNEYLLELKSDIESELSFDFQEDYGIDDKNLAFIKSVIINYIGSIN